MLELQVAIIFRTHVNNKVLAGLVNNFKIGLKLQLAISRSNEESVKHEIIASRVATYRIARLLCDPAGWKF